VAQQDTSQQNAQPSSRASSVNINEVVDLVKDYARQETLGPLRGAGRWIAFGVAGSLLIGTGVLFLVLGLLRLVQNEFGDSFDGRWTGLLPYLFALIASVAVIGITVSRISKSSLHQD
jgi:hypothetical protein